jgi:hypothetical protein
MPERLFAEFGEPRQLAAAARELAGRGLRGLEAHTPYSTRPVRLALGRRRSRLSYAIGVAGFAGAALAYGIEWWTVAEDYPLNVGGRPPHFPLAFVPIAFEMGVLSAAFTAFFGVLLLGRLVRLYDPIFDVDGFESSSVDGFWLAIPLEAPKAETTADLEGVLRGMGARRVVPSRGGAA